MPRRRFTSGERKWFVRPEILPPAGGSLDPKPSNLALLSQSIDAVFLNGRLVLTQRRGRWL